MDTEFFIELNWNLRRSEITILKNDQKRGRIMAVYWVLVARSQTVTKNLNLFNELSILLPISSGTLHSNYWKTGCSFRNNNSSIFCQGSASQTCQKCDKWLKYYTSQILHLCPWLFLHTQTINLRFQKRENNSFRRT